MAQSLSASAAGPKRARWVLAVVVLVAGVVLALVLWLWSGRRYDDAVADLAPAPIGCDTTLVFERTGTYTFFLETTGSVGEIDGDCDNDDRDYDLDPDDAPNVTLLLTDAEGDEVDLDRADGPSYDRDGAVGTGIRTAEIDDEGEYVLSADAADTEAMIRVGRDPASGVVLMRLGAIVALIAGCVAAGLLFWSGRPRPATAPPPSPAFDQWPRHVAPPVGPAVRQPADLAALRRAPPAGAAAPAAVARRAGRAAAATSPTRAVAAGRCYRRRMTVTTRP